MAAGRPSTLLVADGRQLAGTGAAMLGAATVLPLLPELPALGCPLRALTGVPCPLCGMTTSVVATVHLRLADALAANPAGVAAVVLAVVVLMWRPDRLSLRLSFAVVILAVMWFFQLHRFGFL